MSKAKMITQYFDEREKYKKKYGNKFILLWQCGGFYEVYGLKCIKAKNKLETNIARVASPHDFSRYL